MTLTDRVSRPHFVVHRVEGFIFHFDLFSGGFTGRGWLKCLRGEQGYRVSRNAEKILLSDEFVPTPDATLYRLAIIKGAFFVDRRLRTTSNLRVLGNFRGYKAPHPEVSPIMRVVMSDTYIRRVLGVEEVLTMHKPINGRCLDIDTFCLESAPIGDDDTWHKEHGFVFERPSG